MRVLDLFCGAGGASMGYHRAWPDAEIVGVDIAPQPDYPFTFIQGDALEPPVDLEAFDFIHASPPCQAYSVATHDKSLHPELIEPTRALLATFDGPTVMENVPGAPIRGDIMLCGTMFGLESSTGLPLRRHRYFECGKWEPPLFQPHCRHDSRKRTMTVTGHGPNGADFEVWGRHITVQEWREGMGMDWCNRRGLTEAIPPAYTQWIGEQLGAT